MATFESFELLILSDHWIILSEVVKIVSFMILSDAILQLERN